MFGFPAFVFYTMSEPDQDQDGLSEAEALKRLKKVGPNVLVARSGIAWWRIFLRQFTGVHIYILLAAMVIAFTMDQRIDALAIGVIVMLNGGLGFVQEWRAEKTLESLRALLSAKALVVRGGVEKLIDAQNIVPGDRVILRAGSKVPADILLCEEQGLLIDESTLTGESVAVSKLILPKDASVDDSTVAFLGTNVVEGRGIGVVTATGMETAFGKIAALTTSVPREQTHLQKTLGSLGRSMGAIAVGLAGVIILVGWQSGRALDEMVMTGLSLAVAIVPEGLPAVVTVTLALGAHAMVRQKALSRRLQATETLGAASVICTDKTGTLTENQMTLVQIWLPDDIVEVTGTGHDPAGHFEKDGRRFDHNGSELLINLLTSGITCNHAGINKVGEAWEKFGEPTEVALVVAAYKAWLPEPERDDVLREIPFSSKRKCMSVVVQNGSQLVVHAKGAPEVMVEKCSRIAKEGGEVALDDSQRARIDAAYHDMASKGLRVLAIASKPASGSDISDAEMETDLIFLGLVGIIDPPRREVKKAIADAYSAGIEVIMITGDAPQTALAIAGMLGLRAATAITGHMLDDVDEETLAKLLSESVVFARTTPHHKMRIVECLQAQGKIVAMTGDGVNDAPALKRADIGIAMGIRGTDVAKDASDIVLLDDNFASIVSAVQEGRRQYENIRKFVRYLLSSNAGEVIAIIFNIVIGGPLIFVPIQILWMNLVTDGATALTLGLERSEADSMRRPPRNPSEAIVGYKGLFIVLLFAIYTGSASLFAFYSMLEHGVVFAQTVAFSTMVFLEKFSVFAFRSLSLPQARIGFFSNPALLIALALTLGAQVLAVYWGPLQAVLHTTAIDLDAWILLLVLTVPVVLVPELVKYVRAARG